MKICYRRLSAWLLAALGFAGCDAGGIKGEINPWDGPGNTIAMYGVPHAEYVINATVTDEAGNPVKGVKVSGLKAYGESPYKYEQRDTARTGADGKAKVSMTEYPNKELIGVAFTDTDGEANGGTFKTDTLKKLNFTQTLKAQDTWNQGAFEATVTVKLKKQ